MHTGIKLAKAVFTHLTSVAALPGETPKHGKNAERDLLYVQPTNPDLHVDVMTLKSRDHQAVGSIVTLSGAMALIK